jgi:hypothetical protein
MQRWRFAPALAMAAAVASLVVFASRADSRLSFAAAPRPQLPPAPHFVLAPSPKPIYSNDLNDSWNRVFYYLYSRRFDAFLSSEFPESAPVRPFEIMLPTEVRPEMSTRTFVRDEDGDRAIDPLYPSFLRDSGARIVLTDPAYTAFRSALDDALHDARPRSVAALAIMQNDLWSAYDIFHRYEFYKANGDADLIERRQVVLDLLAREIRKIALTPDEIRGLPDNFEAARAKNSLPDLFHPKSGWAEVRWFPYRLHDEAVDFRRVTRIFMKPAQPPRDMEHFLNALRDPEQDRGTALGGVALVTQLLLIDTQGRLQPTNFCTDVQIRMFHKTPEGKPAKTEIQVLEISRKQLVNAAESGGLIAESESDPAYVPAAGNDYSFASVIDTQIGPTVPAVVKLRTRCIACHGSQDLTNVMTFNMIIPPGQGKGPPVQQLDPAKHDSADFVMSRKLRAKDWLELHKTWEHDSLALASR